MREGYFKGYPSHYFIKQFNKNKYNGKKNNRWRLELHRKMYR